MEIAIDSQQKGLKRHGYRIEQLWVFFQGVPDSTKPFCTLISLNHFCVQFWGGNNLKLESLTFLPGGGILVKISTITSITI